jgi:hypothetical protein
MNYSQILGKVALFRLTDYQAAIAGWIQWISPVEKAAARRNHHVCPLHQSHKGYRATDSIGDKKGEGKLVGKGQGRASSSE